MNICSKADIFHLPFVWSVGGVLSICIQWLNFQNVFEHPVIYLLSSCKAYATYTILLSTITDYWSCWSATVASAQAHYLLHCNMCSIRLKIDTTQDTTRSDCHTLPLATNLHAPEMFVTLYCTCWAMYSPDWNSDWSCCFRTLGRALARLHEFAQLHSHNFKKQ